LDHFERKGDIFSDDDSLVIVGLLLTQRFVDLSVAQMLDDSAFDVGVVE